MTTSGRGADTLADALALGRLRQQWALVAFSYVVACGFGYALVNRSWPTVNATVWLLGTSGMLVTTLGILWWGLHHNRQDEGAELWPTLGYGNGLSLVRGLLLCLLTGFIFLPRPFGLLAWVPSLLFTLDRLFDLFDGYVARITNRESQLGARLDIEFDGLDVLVAVLLGIRYGLLPEWYLLLAVSRQLFVAGMWLRTRAGKPNRDLPPSDNRRLIAGFQTGFLSVILWPLFSPPISTLAAVLFAIPLIYSFGRDWLVVSHIIDPDSPRYVAVRNSIKRISEGWFPLVARLGVATFAVIILWREVPAFAHWLPYFAALRVGTPFLMGLAFVFFVATSMVLLGVLGRVASVVLIYLACLDSWASGFAWETNALLLICTVTVAHLGSGYLALWQPEERLLRTQLGKRETA